MAGLIRTFGSVNNIVVTVSDTLEEVAKQGKDIVCKSSKMVLNTVDALNAYTTTMKQKAEASAEVFNKSKYMDFLAYQNDLEMTEELQKVAARITGKPAEEIDENDLIQLHENSEKLFNAIKRK